MTTGNKRGGVLAICGGVGGAKLAQGLYAVLGEKLSVIVNMADDFEHLGLHISPDLDTVLYTLGGLADPERGWGRAGETWNFMSALEVLGGETWFALGDHDLALHIERTRRLAAGETIGEIAQHVATGFGITARILPATNDPIRTVVATDTERLPFQRYFVRHRCEPIVRRITFDGADTARPHPAVIDMLCGDDLSAIIICPSNPYLSVDPILAVPGIRSALANANAPVVAVSPIIGGRAVKGPTAKIMSELNIETTSRSIVMHYRDLIDGLVVDTADATEAVGLGVPVHTTPTLMTDLTSRIALANDVLTFAGALSVGNARKRMAANRA